MPTIQPVKRATAPAKPAENGQARKAHEPIIVADAETPEWWEARKVAIGSSDAAAAVGLDPYRCAAQLYREKRGEAGPIEENNAMRFGKRFEPAILAEWEHQTGKKSTRYPVPMHRHAEHYWMVATPDACFGDRQGIELKTMTPFLAMRLDSEGVANVVPHYLIQVQHQMAVMDWEEITLVVFWAQSTSDWKVVEYPIERNDRLIERLIAKEEDLWQRIQEGRPPEVDTNHPKIGSIVKELFPRVATGKVLELSADAVAAWERYQERKAQIKTLESENEQDRASVLLEIGENLGGALPSGKVVKRIAIAPSSYTVNRKASIQVREVSGKNLTVVPAEAEPETEEQAAESRFGSLFNAADDLLKGMGYVCYSASQHGSKYYVHLSRDDVGRVRVADHSPNDTTRKRMQRDGDLSVRLDELGETEAVQRVLSEFRAEKQL